MRSTRLSFLPIVVLAVTACSSGTEPAAPAQPRLVPDQPTLNNGAGVVLSVHGAGVVDFTSASAGTAPFQFVAWRRADGTVGGHFRQSRVRATGTVDFEGAVTCVTTDPNFPERARIGGVVTANNSTDPAFQTVNHAVGADVWFRIESGNTGADAGDKSTTYGFKPVLVNTSAEYCALPFTGFHNGQNVWSASIFPLAQGQITIHDRQ